MLRDRIRALAHIQSHQSIALPSIDEADIFAAHAEGGQVCVQVFFLRAGQNFGNRAYFPSHARNSTRPTCCRPSSASSTKRAGTQADPDQPRRRRARVAGKRAGHDGRPQGRDPPSQARRPEGRARPGASLNAREALARRMAERGTQRQLLEGVARVFELDAPPERIEIYDNSHIQGTAPIGAMVVAGPEGFIKNQLSQVQHQDRGRGGRRLRHDARGADAPLRPRAARRIPNATRSTGPTWC